jgi:SAM-dependent methyltransferase
LRRRVEAARGRRGAGLVGAVLVGARLLGAVLLGVVLLGAVPRGTAPRAAPSEVGAREAAEYTHAAASPDGTGKFYEGREIAQVMGFDGAPWLDRPSRESEERPDLLIEELKLQPAMTIADIGAGSGYFERRLAPLLPQGKIYAVDVQPEMVDLLGALAREPATHNVVPILGAEDDVKLPANSLDLALLVDVYHELAFPAEITRSLLTALKPGGRLVFVEYRLEDPAVAIKPLHKMSVVQLRREMRSFPLTWERTSERLPVQHIVIFRKN